MKNLKPIIVYGLWAAEILYALSINTHPYFWKGQGELFRIMTIGFDRIQKDEGDKEMNQKAVNITSHILIGTPIPRLDGEKGFEK